MTSDAARIQAKAEEMSELAQTQRERDCVKVENQQLKAQVGLRLGHWAPANASPGVCGWFRVQIECLYKSLVARLQVLQLEKETGQLAQKLVERTVELCDKSVELSVVGIGVFPLPCLPDAPCCTLMCPYTS